MAKQDGYENALTKTIKGLRKLNEEMSRELDEKDKIILVANPDETGEVVIYPIWTVLFEYKSLAELGEWLEATPLKRIKMSRESKK